MNIELNIGDKRQESISFTTDQVKQFSEISGDKNPIHIDAEYAAKTKFKKCIVPGILACSVFPKMIANDFPGAGSIYLEQSVAFKNPVYLNEECIAVIKVLNKRVSSKGQLIYKLSLLLTDTNENVLIEGMAAILK